MVSTFVPFVDLKSEYQRLRDKLIPVIHGVCRDAAFILGNEVSMFEQEFANFVGGNYCVGVANGTEALLMALRALNIGAGHEVLVPAHTFIASALAVVRSGARPVLVDVNPESYLINLDLAPKAITSATKAIMPVHLYGRSCDMDQISSLAERYSLTVIEDAAQSHGSMWKGKSTGTFGSAGCFSFYPGKNLGAYGDGGGIVVKDPELAKRLRRLRNYGSEVKYHHEELGDNSRLDTIQAAILRVKLRYLEEWNSQRITAALMYRDLLKSLNGLKLPEFPQDMNEHVFHLFVIRVHNRDHVRQRLGEYGIETGIHYPHPFYLQGAMHHLGYTRGAFPETEKLCEEILSLPIFPGITATQIEYVVEKLTKILR